MSKLVILKKQQDFEKFRKSKVYSSAWLRLRVSAAAKEHPRFGLIVSKKTLSAGSDRNRLRRRLKEIIRRHLDHVRPADILVLPSKDALRQKPGKLKEGVVKLFKQAGLWKS